jgi:mRNA interferase MazF
LRRGEVWWAELEGDAGFRPVAIVSRSDLIAARRNITIAEVTRVVRRIASEVALSRADGMPSECVINTDNLHTVPKDCLRERITTLRSEQEFALANSLRYSLGLDW